MTYKMKGSPMKRNFGIGESPLPQKDVPFKVLRKDLDDGVLGEANNDGTIFLSKDIKKGSKKEAEVTAHEGKHMDDMEKGILNYTDDHVEYQGKKHERKDGMINYNGKWLPEGDESFPWEKRAYKAGNAAAKKVKK